MNLHTRIFVATLGSVFGLSGLSHGFFEFLQGNTPTEGPFIAAIGPAQRMWPHGSEYAFTLIPNFQATGIAAMLLGLAVMVCSIAFAQKPKGPAMLLGLFLLLLLTGGGVAQVLFFPFIVLAATRIPSPLTWWRIALPEGGRKNLAALWPWCLGAALLLFVFVLQIAITGFVPGVTDPETALSVMAVCLGLEVILIPLTYVSGIARDILEHPADPAMPRGKG